MNKKTARIIRAVFLLPALLYELYQFLYEVCPIPDDHYNGDQRVQEIQDAYGHHSHL